MGCDGGPKTGPTGAHNQDVGNLRSVFFFFQNGLAIVPSIVGAGGSIRLCNSSIDKFGQVQRDVVVDFHRISQRQPRGTSFATAPDSNAWFMAVLCLGIKVLRLIWGDPGTQTRTQTQGSFSESEPSLRQLWLQKSTPNF